MYEKFLGQKKDICIFFKFYKWYDKIYIYRCKKLFEYNVN